MKIFIRDFVTNQTVSTTFLVKAKEYRDKKGGGQYLTLTLADRTGDIAGHWWDNFEDSAETFKVDDIVFARGQVIVHRNRLQLTVHRMRPCEEREYELADYFPTTKYNVDEMFAELMQTVQSFANPHLRQLLENIFADETTVKKFKRAPAAKTMHHPYLGGLLEHTLSLVRLAQKVGSHYDGIDLDLLQAGAVLHDFGKIDELTYERGTNYSDDGQMIGHLAMETMMVSEHIREIPDFPEELRRHLLHLLLTHHGKLEYGSPKLPSTPEALMLAYLDDLDSKIEAMQRLIAEPHASGPWTRISPMFERPIYRRRPNGKLEEPVAEPAPATIAAAIPNSNGDGDAKPKPAKVVQGSFNNPFAQLAELIKE
ncbi:MAG: OB-fold nucleic acid binding domain-containing protein [Blastocatellia bacterium]